MLPLPKKQEKLMNEEKNATVTQGIYSHFKGKRYEAYGTFTHTETGEELVAYRALYEPFAKCVRPKAMFVEEVDRPELGYKGPRFAFTNIYSFGIAEAEACPNQLFDVFTHTETGEKFVIYRSLHGPKKSCAKPWGAFVEEVLRAELAG